MMIFSRRLILFLLPVLLLALPAGAQELARSALTVATAGGAEYRFTVELAVTPEEQAKGLMFRDRMADDAGMLFTYDRVQPVSFWMRNTLIPLDLIFIGRDGRIVHIHENAKPLDETPIASNRPVLAVLEINGGLARRLGIRVGDRVLHAHFAD